MNINPKLSVIIFIESFRTAVMKNEMLKIQLNLSTFLFSGWSAAPQLKMFFLMMLFVTAIGFGTLAVPVNDGGGENRSAANQPLSHPAQILNSDLKIETPFKNSIL